MTADDQSMTALMLRFPRAGRVEWIGLRSGRRADVVRVDAAYADVEGGLEGDHFSGPTGARRQVTLVQSEHLDVMAHLLGLPEIRPELLRRNIVVSGINLLALVKARFRIGSATLAGTGLCQPCSRMEENLGVGGWNAMRGHGGITATVIAGGTIRLGDTVVFESIESSESSAD
jgi:MOSC domain-containing protein YiiM